MVMLSHLSYIPFDSLSLYIYNTYHLSVRLLIEMYLYKWYVTMDNFNLFLNKLDY